MIATKGKSLDFSTPQSPKNAFSGIFTYLKLVLKYYNFATCQHILCKTYDKLLQKQAVNLNLKCIFCIANSSYAVKIPKDEVTCNTYWDFYKKLKIWTCFPQNRRFWDQTGGQETTSQNRSLPLKMGGLERMGSTPQQKGGAHYVLVLINTNILLINIKLDGIPNKVKWNMHTLI